MAAFLAPEPVPLTLFGDHAELLEEPLRSTASDPDALTDTVGALVGYSLARRHPDGFQLHRLVQAVIRHQLPPDRQQATAERVLALLAAAAPGEPDHPASWVGYARLAPHVLATAPLADHSSAGQQLALGTTRYLQAHGDSYGSRTLAEQLFDRWRPSLGADHPNTLRAAGSLTLALISVGETEAARGLGEDTVQRCRRVHGLDHPTTLEVAGALALTLVQLGEAEPARTLAQDTLQRCRRVLGPDHTTTLATAAAFTLVLARLAQAQPGHTVGRLGEAEPARTLAQDTLQRCRRVLRPDHPITLGAGTALTLALIQLGKAELARDLGQDILQHSRQVYGFDHPTTLWAAAALTDALAHLSEVEPARALGEDTLARCLRVLGPEHPVALYLTRVASIT
jgi:hypothetical protein